METVIITGVSGAGKTQAIDYFEDFGYFCIDNMPIQLLPKFMDLCKEAGQKKVAIVIDIRSIAFQKDLSGIKDLYQLKEDKDSSILFLDSDDATLVRRYQQTRRKHPLIAQAGVLEKAIEQERAIMEEMKDLADEVIDTSELKPGDLHDQLKEIYDKHEASETMLINIVSFGFKYGAPRSADFVFDTRFLPNPFWIEELRSKTGEDKEVRDYVLDDTVAKEYFENIVNLLKGIIPSYLQVDKRHLTIAFGCTGGQHRSVTYTYLLAKEFKKEGYQVSVEHRDILKDRLKY